MKSQCNARVRSQVEKSPCVSPLIASSEPGKWNPLSAGGGGDQEQLQGLSWASVIFYWGAVFMSIVTLQKCIKFM